MMKTLAKKPLFFGLLILTIASFSAHVSAQKGNHPLWQVSNGSNTVYLCGSVHVLKAEHYPLDEVFEIAFNKSDVLVLEINLDSAASPGAMQIIMRKSLNQDGSSLADKLPENVYVRLKEKADSIGIPVFQLNMMKPWSAAVTLMGLELQKQGFDPERGMDRYFFNLAKDRNMLVIGLETVEFQIGLFDGLPDSLQAEMVQQTLDDLAVMQTDFEALISAWQNGDTKKLSELLTESFQSYPEIKDLFLYKRNKDWIPAIESFLAGPQTEFIVVGAAHLVGENSVVDLLKQKGYQVIQL